MRVAALILAAGQSRRFGNDNKLLSDIAGEPLVCRVARNVRRAGLAIIAAVVDAEESEVAKALASSGLELIVNANSDAGMGTSISAGVRALQHKADGIVIVPGDMPALSPDLIERIVSAFSAHNGNKIIVPCLSDGSQRNPVLWPRQFYPDLLRLDGDHGAKPLLQKFSDTSVSVSIEDPGITLDIDTPAELTAYLATLRAS